MGDEFKQIETSIGLLESERNHLRQECNRLRGETTWYREKISQLEKTLVATDVKQEQMKRHLEEQRNQILLLEGSLKTENSFQEKYFQLIKDYDHLEEKCKLLELNSKSNRYYTDYTNEKLEKEYALLKVKELQQQLLNAEKEKDDFKNAYDRLLLDVSNLRNKDTQNDYKLEQIQIKLKESNEKISYLTHKVSKYKRKLVKSKNNSDATNLMQQNEKITELTAQLQNANSRYSSLHTQLQLAREQADQANEENTHLKSLINQLNLYIGETDQTKKMLSRELEQKNAEIQKKNRFIQDFVKPQFKTLLK